MQRLPVAPVACESSHTKAKGRHQTKGIPSQYPTCEEKSAPVTYVKRQVQNMGKAIKHASKRLSHAWMFISPSLFRTSDASQVLLLGDLAHVQRCRVRRHEHERFSPSLAETLGKIKRNLAHKDQNLHRILTHGPTHLSHSTCQFCTAASSPDDALKCAARTLFLRTNATSSCWVRQVSFGSESSALASSPKVRVVR